ncbi:MAG: hypothetical protein ACTHLB_07280 [Parafilimonas sp.]
MLADYTKLVLGCYAQKRAANILSSRLISPTPAKLRDECVALFAAGIKRKDQAALNTFFEGKAGEDVDLKAMEKYDRDKFKPLWKFITGRINDTDIKNIELLAWLIDFEPRPFVYGKRYDADSTILVDNAIEETRENDEKELVMMEPKSLAGIEKQTEGSQAIKPVVNNNRFRLITRPFIIIAILILVIGVIYWLKKDDEQAMNPFSTMPVEGCMYWAGDHYELTACNEKHGNALVIALDTFALRHLKKINRPDTITLNAIGSVWYIRTSGSIEYFTAPGAYPSDLKKHLKPLTEYIFKHHLEQGVQ